MKMLILILDWHIILYTVTKLIVRYIESLFYVINQKHTFDENATLARVSTSNRVFHKKL